MTLNNMLIFGEMCQHFNYISRLQARVFFDNSAFKWIVNVMSGKETTPVPSAYRREVLVEMWNAQCGASSLNLTITFTFILHAIYK